jgi:hypothetical protein
LFWATTTNHHPSLAANVSGGVSCFVLSDYMHHPSANASGVVSRFILSDYRHHPLLRSKCERGGGSSFILLLAIIPSLTANVSRGGFLFHSQ